MKAKDVRPAKFVGIETKDGRLRLPVWHERFPADMTTDDREYVVQAEIGPIGEGAVIPHGAWATVYDTAGDYIAEFQLRVGDIYMGPSDTLRVTWKQRYQRTSTGGALW